MTRTEFNEMCAPYFIWHILPSGKKVKISEPDQFMAMWEDIIPKEPDHKILGYMEAAKPHTQITDANPNLCWLYDRLMMVCVERGI